MNIFKNNFFSSQSKRVFSQTINHNLYNNVVKYLEIQISERQTITTKSEYLNIFNQERWLGKSAQRYVDFFN